MSPALSPPAPPECDSRLVLELEYPELELESKQEPELEGINDDVEEDPLLLLLGFQLELEPAPEPAVAPAVAPALAPELEPELEPNIENGDDTFETFNCFTLLAVRGANAGAVVVPVTLFFPVDSAPPVRDS